MAGAEPLMICNTRRSLGGSGTEGVLTVRRANAPAESSLNVANEQDASGCGGCRGVPQSYTPGAPLGDRTGDALRALHDLRGDPIDEILREPPDGRRVSTQLMRVHI